MWIGRSRGSDLKASQAWRSGSIWLVMGALHLFEPRTSRITRIRHEPHRGAGSGRIDRMSATHYLRGRLRGGGVHPSPSFRHHRPNPKEPSMSRDLLPGVTGVLALADGT